MINAAASIGVYAFLGNDHTPTFYRKGIVKQKSIELKDDKCVDIFSNFVSVPLSQSMLSETERFACCIMALKIEIALMM